MKNVLVVGLEIHVQLATQTKLFCGCKLGFNDPPNSNVCPVCLGLPGALPVLNRRAYEYSVKTALALNCEIVPFTKWDRKSYYYPDLPKNYQTSQYDLPMSRDGYLDIPLEDGRHKRVRILRAHLEEDAGKNQHEGLPHSRVDLNRTGTPLLEIVTEPDLSSAAECRALAMELQKIVQFLGVSHANMQMGHMRFEPNVNLHIVDDDGHTYKTPICEVKNLNSFKALEGAVNYEQWRHLEEWKKNRDFTLEKLGKENRGWDDQKNVTVFQRGKEEAHDYRYFPCPDLVPVTVDDAWITEIRADMNELPETLRKRFVEEYDLSEYDAGVLTSEPAAARFFDDAVKLGAPPKRVANLVTQQGLRIANEQGCTLDAIGITIEQLVEVAKLIDDGTINASAGNTLFEKLLTDDRDARTVAQKSNLIQLSDSGELDNLIDEVVAANTSAVEEFRSGGKKAGKARGFLLGQVMQKTKGQANPKVAGDLLDQKLKT